VSITVGRDQFGESQQNVGPVLVSVGNDQSGVSQQNVGLVMVTVGNDQSVNVYQRFYLDTLDLSPASKPAVNKPAPYTHISSNDMKGKHTNRVNKITDAIIQDVKQRINRFPPVE
jgi:hypothetical protein